MTVQQKASGEAIERLLKRGVAQIEKEADLRRLLLEGNKGQPLRVKLGVDPSHYDLTIGHAVVFCKLRQFQQLGHKAVVVIGDWTARLGDPSGREEARQALTAEQRLPQRRRNRIAEGLAVIVRRNEYRRGTHSHGSSNDSALRASLVSHPGSSSNCRTSPRVSQ